MMPNGLPVDDVLDELRYCLESRDEAVLEAPPGSGKTTVAPLAMLDQSWLAGKKVIMLEPRRIAARAAAWRMAESLGETPGQTVGYRMRLETRVGPHTRLEVITEGILTRMLQEDPALAETGLVIFDEFHERSLDADLALSLCLKGRALFRAPRDPLKLLVMSATLDIDKVVALLDEAPVVRAEGRMFPVEVTWLGRGRPDDRVTDRTIAAVVRALRESPRSSVLVFLPGQGEIARCEVGLREALTASRLTGVRLCPLFGNLTIEQQQVAIAPVTTPGERKVVLATNIAETSLTIEGVDVVVDSGLVREPVYDPETGMTRLRTRRISRASSEQRMGRAGRLRPGRCYRLWSEQNKLAPHREPEILAADLTPLALQLFQWGAASPSELDWLDAPPNGAWCEAVDRLVVFGALDGERHHLTPQGEAMARLPVHPRLARLLIRGVAIGRLNIASLLAAALSDRNPLGESNPDLAYTVDVLTGETQCPAPAHGWLRRTRQLAGQYASQVSRLPAERQDTPPDDAVVGYLVACAYPDRIARRRLSGGFQLANGRAASLGEYRSPGNAPWLAVAEVGGMARRKGDIIRSAAVLDESLFGSLLAEQVAEKVVVEWDKREDRLVAERRRMIGALVLKRARLDRIPAEAKRAALVRHIRDAGLGTLPWTSRERQWQARVMLLRALQPSLELPDVSDTRLIETLSDWLGPSLDSIGRLGDFARVDLRGLLDNMLTFRQRRTLAELLPERITVPSGSVLQVDYSKSPPVLAVKLQEMFGCEVTPTVAQGRVALLVHLLSPAGRPVQITQDLAGFWKTSYQAVKKEMKGRYPKHIWPDDPLSFEPTRRTTKRR